MNNFEIADHDAATAQHLTHNSTVVRVLGLIAFLLATAAVVVSGVHNARNPFEEFPAFDTPGQKLIATYSYFTLWSNIVGAGLGLAYFLGNHESRWAAAARIDAAMMLLVTGLVYNFVLADGSPSVGTYRFTNPVEHDYAGVDANDLDIVDAAKKTRRYYPHQYRIGVDPSHHLVRVDFCPGRRDRLVPLFLPRRQRSRICSGAEKHRRRIPAVLRVDRAARRG